MYKTRTCACLRGKNVGLVMWRSQFKPHLKHYFSQGTVHRQGNSDSKPETGETLDIHELASCFYITSELMLKVTKTFNECEQERKENIEDKGENAGLQHFLILLQSFQKNLVPWSTKFG